MTDGRGQQPGTFALATAITRTCRLCREESLSLLKQGGTHYFDFNELINIPIGHPFFDTVSRRHVVIRQTSRQDGLLESTEHLLARFPKLSTLRVILPDVHAASLRGYGTFENLVRNPKLRTRLLQLIEHQTYINTFFDQSSYLIGEALRETIEKYAGCWRPGVHIQGRIDLPRSQTAFGPVNLQEFGDSYIDLNLLRGTRAVQPDEVRFLTYRVNVVTGEKNITSDDGTEFRLAGLHEKILVRRIPAEIISRYTNNHITPKSNALSILQLCREIRQEALPLFFDKVTFDCAVDEFGSFPDISAPLWSRLRTLHIRNYPMPVYDDFIDPYIKENYWMLGERLFPAVPLAFPALQHLIISDDYAVPVMDVHGIWKFTTGFNIDDLLQIMDDRTIHEHPLRVFKLCLEALVSRLRKEASRKTHDIRKVTYNARLRTCIHEPLSSGPGCETCSTEQHTTYMRATLGGGESSIPVDLRTTMSIDQYWRLIATSDEGVITINKDGEHKDVPLKELKWDRSRNP
ncbi:uncharacterized protein AB675_4805 [Cyphellophora attinorum]|uniref:Uncharacterized protein n=1 Tax=Cyphellophora attinorum TaxID=1664694 RepID=A0A0N1HLY2_9EURO|nr:uncharacterized protein AB675_4805 [Phialophora attinorum]KPI35660.1 hypothetical protein AB675_4805 [Phialophora attinorum]